MWTKDRVGRCRPKTAPNPEQIYDFGRIDPIWKGFPECFWSRMPLARFSLDRDRGRLWGAVWSLFGAAPGLRKFRCGAGFAVFDNRSGVGVLPRGTEVGPEWGRSGSGVGPEWVRSGSGVGPEWGWSGSGVGPCLSVWSRFARVEIWSDPVRAQPQLFGPASECHTLAISKLIRISGDMLTGAWAVVGPHADQ
jgi:hypothetical protein